MLVFSAFVHGFVLALGLILPLGVQNVFVFNQGAMHKKFRSALPVVVTASLCDTILLALAILGVSVLILGAGWLRYALLLAGIAFLLYMAWATWNSKPNAANDKQAETFSARKQITYAASVSLFNPHAIMDTVGVIGTSSLSYSGSEKWVFGLSCIAVSWLWFFSLALAGRFVRRLDASGKFLYYVNKVSAVFILLSALYMMFLF